MTHGGGRCPWSCPDRARATKQPGNGRCSTPASIPPRRFAATTHAGRPTTAVTSEDLIVSLADKIWKIRRVPDLEQRVVDQLAAASGEEPWPAFPNLDDLLSGIAEEADRRLAFQNGYATTAFRDGAGQGIRAPG